MRGWATVPKRRGGKYHYFLDDRRSLCGRHTHKGPYDTGDPHVRTTIDCPRCRYLFDVSAGRRRRPIKKNPNQLTLKGVE